MHAFANAPQPYQSTQETSEHRPVAPAKVQLNSSACITVKRRRRTAPPQSLVPRQQQLEAALEELAGAHHTCAELLKALPDSHPAYPALLAAMEGAPSLFVLGAGGSSGEGAVEGDGAGLGPDDSGGEGEQPPHAGRGGPNQGGRGKQQAAGAAQQAQRGRRRRRRRLQDIKNPFVRAIIAEGGYHAGGLWSAPCWQGTWCGRAGPVRVA